MQPAVVLARADGAGGERLDLAYFKARILPIFNRIGEDGQNCVGCHRSHTILKMVPPGKDGEWPVDAVRDNYGAALRVVNLANPTDSLLLGKPTWEAAEEAEAQNDPSKKAHAGGVRFDKDSPEFQTVLDWINGARLSRDQKSESQTNELSLDRCSAAACCAAGRTPNRDHA